MPKDAVAAAAAKAWAEIVAAAPPIPADAPAAAQPVGDAGANAAREALTRLQAASDLTALSGEEREALAVALIQALSHVHDEINPLDALRRY